VVFRLEVSPTLRHYRPLQKLGPESKSALFETIVPEIAYPDQRAEQTWTTRLNTVSGEPFQGEILVSSCHVDDSS